MTPATELMVTMQRSVTKTAKRRKKVYLHSSAGRMEASLNVVSGFIYGGVGFYRRWWFEYFRRDKEYCHECRYCCTLSVCTTAAGTIYLHTNKTLEELQHTGHHSNAPTANPLSAADPAIPTKWPDPILEENKEAVTGIKNIDLEARKKSPAFCSVPAFFRFQFP